MLKNQSSCILFSFFIFFVNIIQSSSDQEPKFLIGRCNDLHARIMHGYVTLGNQLRLIGPLDTFDMDNIDPKFQINEIVFVSYVTYQDIKATIDGFDQNGTSPWVTSSKDFELIKSRVQKQEVQLQFLSNSITGMLQHNSCMAMLNEK